MEKKKILIVDDDKDLTIAIQAILENKNYMVVTAINKTEGWEKLKSEKGLSSKVSITLKGGFLETKPWKTSTTE